MSSRPLEATAFQIHNIRIAYVFYESGLLINVMDSVDNHRASAFASRPSPTSPNRGSSPSVRPPASLGW
jgi:hypothetical protein